MEENILFFLFSFLIILFLALRLYRSRVNHKKHPPSPPAIPLIGHIHLLKQPLHRSLHHLSHKYGPILSLRFGTRPVLVVSSPSAVEECFTKNDIVFANRPRALEGKHFAYNYSNLAYTPYGDLWRNLRRISAIELFSSHRLNSLQSQSIRREEVKRLIENLSSFSLRDFAKVEMKSKFQYLTFDIMMGLIAGNRHYSASNERGAKEFRALMEEIIPLGGATNPRDLFPILNWIDCGRYEKKMMNLAKRADEFYQRLIDAHKIRNGNMNSMIDHLLSLQQSEPEYYTDDFIKALVQIMLFAGTDTSALTLEWALSNLVNHPRLLRKARGEIKNQVGEGCLLDEHHLSKLPYLQNIISETLRLHPVVPLLVPHMSSDDCTVGGYNVPRGTMLLVNAWAMHRDPTLWDDPTSFKPERFDGAEGEGYKLMPFGLGRRSCPGSGLAQRVVGLTLGSLIQCFEWEKVDDKKIDTGEGQGGSTAPKAAALEAMCKARPIVNNIFFSQPIHYS